MSDSNTLSTLTKAEESRIIETLRLTKARMTALLTYFQPLYDKEGLKFEGDADITERLMHWINGDYTYSVEEYKSLFANLFFGKNNLRKAIAAWPRPMLTAVATAVGTGFVSLSFLTSLVRENPESWTDRLGNSVTLSLDKLKTLFTTSTSNSASYLSIDSSIAEAVSGAISPARTIIASYDKLPDENLTVFNGEAEIISLAPEVLRCMKEKDIFARGSATPYAEKDVKYISSTAGLRELFTSKPPKHLAMFRTRAVMFILQMATAFTRNNKDTANILRHYFADDLWAVYAQYVNIALPYFQRLGGPVTDGMSQRYLTTIYHWLLQFCEKNPAAGSPGQWISLEALVNQLGDKAAAKGHYGIVISQLHSIHPKNTVNDTDITPANALNQFTKPLFYGCYLILAALGLAEVAYEDTEPDEDAPFSHFRYIRLTRLGRYVFGFDSTYKPDFAIVRNPPTAILDPDNLIIRTTTEAAAATVRKLLGNKKSSNRFVVTEGSVLAGVSTENDLKKKLETLRMIVKSDFPPLWESFFKKVLDKFGSIKSLSTNDMLLYDISPDNAELCRIITSDTNIRQLVRLVEGGSFIIDRKDFGTLGKLLESYGYRLPEPVNSHRNYYWR